MSLQTVIVDDEPIALDILENYIQRLDVLVLAGRFTSPSKAFQLLQTEKIDLLFLDINMPNLTGIELLQALSHPPKVIFTTAYSDYALLGYELDIVDYLLKPIAYPRFLKALNKVIKLEGISHLAASSPSAIAEPSYIFIQVNKKMQKIQLADILYLESIGNYVKIHTTIAMVVAHSSLSYMEEKLPADQFIRIHRSFIIALTQLTAYTHTNVEIADQTLPLSRNYKIEFLKRIKKKEIF